MLLLPDIFGSYQKGREFAIDRNWQDLKNYEAIEAARNANDAGALQLLNTRASMPLQLSVLSDVASNSARNEGLQRLAVPGSVANIQSLNMNAQDQLGLLGDTRNNRYNSNRDYINAQVNQQNAQSGATNAQAQAQEGINAVNLGQNKSGQTNAYTVGQQGQISKLGQVQVGIDKTNLGTLQQNAVNNYLGGRDDNGIIRAENLGTAGAAGDYGLNLANAGKYVADAQQIMGDTEGRLVRTNTGNTLQFDTSKNSATSGLNFAGSQTQLQNVQTEQNRGQAGAALTKQDNGQTRARNYGNAQQDNKLNIGESNIRVSNAAIPLNENAAIKANEANSFASLADSQTKRARGVYLTMPQAALGDQSIAQVIGQSQGQEAGATQAANTINALNAIPLAEKKGQYDLTKLDTNIAQAEAEQNTTANPYATVTGPAIAAINNGGPQGKGAMATLINNQNIPAKEYMQFIEDPNAFVYAQTVLNLRGQGAWDTPENLAKFGLNPDGSFKEIDPQRAQQVAQQYAAQGSDSNLAGMLGGAGSLQVEPQLGATPTINRINGQVQQAEQQQTQQGQQQGGPTQRSSYTIPENTLSAQTAFVNSRNFENKAPEFKQGAVNALRRADALRIANPRQAVQTMQDFLGSNPDQGSIKAFRDIATELGYDDVKGIFDRNINRGQVKDAKPDQNADPFQQTLQLQPSDALTVRNTEDYLRFQTRPENASDDFRRARQLAFFQTGLTKDRFLDLENGKLRLPENGQPPKSLVAVVQNLRSGSPEEQQTANLIMDDFYRLSGNTQGNSNAK